MSSLNSANVRRQRRGLSVEDRYGYIFRRMTAEQVPAVAELARIVWGDSTINESTLAAKFRTKPFGAEYVGYLAYPPDAKPEIAGYPVPAAYYGVYPLAVRLRGEEVLCAQSGETMTHPDHRGRGLFILLARKCYAAAREEGVQFVFGFPNENSYSGFARKLEWKFPYNMVGFSRMIPTLPTGLLRRRMGGSCLGFGAFSHALAARLFEVVEPAEEPWTTFNEESSAVIRDARLWEFKASSTLCVRKGKIGLVLKFDGELSIGEIMGDPSRDEMAAIMRRLSLFAALIGAVRIKSYFSPGSRLELMLAPFGRCNASLPYGYVSFGCEHDLDLLKFAYLDYDTF